MVRAKPKNQKVTTNIEFQFSKFLGSLDGNMGDFPSPLRGEGQGEGV